MYSILFIKRRASLLLVMLVYFLSASLWAADVDCGSDYEVASGDTLSLIAERAYDDSTKFNLIYYANQETLSGGPSVIKVGQKLRIPCTEAEQSTEPAPESNLSDADTPPDTSFSGGRRVELLTAGDYPPFTDPDLPNNGMISELLTKALESSQVEYRLNWIHDWSAHFDPLLTEKKYDVGFPWFDPGCPEADSPRCDFIFSKPIFELLIFLFTLSDQPIAFNQDSDIEGKTLCRPAGYFTHDLDNHGRNWLKEGKITLVQPQIIRECFRLLVEGEVDAVAINDFTGRDTIAKMGLTGKVVPLERELSIQGMHALVHKTNPRATILINRINRGLSALHTSGRYDEIMDRHLLNHWKTVEEQAQ